MEAVIHRRDEWIKEEYQQRTYSCRTISSIAFIALHCIDGHVEITFIFILFCSDLMCFVIIVICCILDLHAGLDGMKRDETRQDAFQSSQLVYSLSILYPKNVPLRCTFWPRRRHKRHLDSPRNHFLFLIIIAIEILNPTPIFNSTLQISLSLLYANPNQPTTQCLPLPLLRTLPLSRVSLPSIF